MKNATLNWVRLPLDSLDNCRELGGYSTRFGQQTKWHSFLRSSDMSKLTQEDNDFLKQYGLKTVIDLRGADEIEKHKNPLAEVDFCNYHNIPFITKEVSDITFSTYKVTMGDFYIDLLEQKSDSVKKIFDVIAGAEEGCILFHCAAGKDRTGILAMLLLGLAGVERKDIVSNYEVTYTNLESMHHLVSSNENIPQEYMYSNRDYILKAYEYILETYQSVDQYLIAKDVDQYTIDQIRERFLGLGEIVVS
ncbi:tyrosine-protein phosphatase [Oceanobacillus kimchii]|uniref:tyrosine-protein phosphatase n=1 Tax=Oceanobacillus kimchii TaxID=746691 RepID=UPI00232EFA2F|nr:tyrosine-protein phosphatase [Oceanobacillus kimchii]